MIEEIDVLRDAVVTYMPGYDKNDFKTLRKVLEWIDNLDQVICTKETKK
jgi:hypothetical protein